MNYTKRSRVIVPKLTIFLCAISYCFLSVYAAPRCVDDMRPDVTSRSDCREYVVCQSGKLVIRTCPIGYSYHVASASCKTGAHASDCRDKVKLVCYRPYGFFVKPGSDCQEYYECKNGIGIEKKCPYDELFNENTERCNMRDDVDCVEKDPECPLLDGKFLVVNTACESYVLCQKGRATFRKCPKWTIFSETFQRCVSAEYNSCPELIVRTPTGMSPTEEDPTLIYYRTSTETTSSESTTIFMETDSTISRTTRETPDPSSSEKSSTDNSSGTANSISTRSVNNSISTTEGHDFSKTIEITFSSTKTTVTDAEKTIATEKVSDTAETEIAEATSSPAKSTNLEIQSFSHTGATSKLSTSTEEVSETDSSPAFPSTTRNRFTTDEVTTVNPTTEDACETFGNPDCLPNDEVCLEQSGLFPHPHSKRLFIHCDHWRPYIKNCPHNLEFDPNERVCDWPSFK